MATFPALRSLLSRDIGVCLSFYTRLPLAPDSSRSFAEAQWAAPLAGLVVGLLVTGVALLLSLLSVPPTISAVIVLACSIALTGGLHEDGLADVADGFGGGQTRERKLEIMKDSRVGTYGVLALVLSVLVRWSALSLLLADATSVAAIAIICAHAASRAPIPWFMATVIPARSDGLSAGVGTVERSTATVALCLGVLTLLPLGAVATFSTIIVLASITLFIHWLTHRQIGGQTGDVLGALQQACEIGVLVTAVTLMT